jgi:hypothetical protein
MAAYAIVVDSTNWLTQTNTLANWLTANKHFGSQCQALSPILIVFTSPLIHGL